MENIRKEYKFKCCCLGSTKHSGLPRTIREKRPGKYLQLHSMQYDGAMTVILKAFVRRLSEMCMSSEKYRIKNFIYRMMM